MATIEERLKSIDSQLQRIDRKLIMLLTERKKETWIPASLVMEMTGWNRDQMFRYRADGIVKFKKKGKSFTYLLESINPIFITNEKYK